MSTPQKNVLKLTRKQAWPMVQHVFPDYNGRHFKAEFTPSITLYNTLWDGGSKNEYAAVNMAGVSHAMPTFSEHGIGQKVEVEAGTAIVMRMWFCGRDIGVTIYMNPTDAPRWIPQ